VAVGVGEEVGVSEEQVAEVRTALGDVVGRYSSRWTRDAVDIATYLSRQVDDASHREVVGPLLAASGGSGVVYFAGEEVASWGDPDVAEMAFSATKSVVSVVAGVAYDQGLLRPDQPIAEAIALPALDGPLDERVTWAHLLQQTSQWEGSLWGKPTSVDLQSFREGTEVHDTAPGEGWAYNDVRMNLLTYALTVLFGRSLADVLAEHVMGPLGASSTWSWYGYSTSHVTLAGRVVPVVSGGAHWGGGLFISARDLARIGLLYLDGGTHDRQRLISREWIDRSWTPCPVKAEYGYLWWLNDQQIPWPSAPVTGRSARGNGGRHLLWVDPARRLVLASHWTESPDHLIRDVSATVRPRLDP
jgi:CubicO group peptidase (beta-lactamase class C family)